MKIIISCCFFVLSSCSTIPLVSEHAREYLERNNYPTEFIERVIARQKLTHQEQKKLANCKSEYVRTMLAQNPFIAHEILKIMVYDNNNFVVQGAASNKKIDRSMIEKLFLDNESAINMAMASNSSIHERVLLDIYYRETSYHKRSLLFLSYAKNKNIPDEIRSDIENSNDEISKTVLRKN